MNNTVLTKENILDRTLSTYTVREGITRIGEGAFIDYSNLEEIILPDSLRYLPREAFYGCKKLNRILSSNINILPDNMRKFHVLSQGLSRSRTSVQESLKELKYLLQQNRIVNIKISKGTPVENIVEMNDKLRLINELVAELNRVSEASEEISALIGEVNGV